ncbi:unnamed protein product [Caenorhabditis bovis]|uniref:Phospholipase A-2-activating protein n=1 Tax=Caenorhabditis bovis TaxID=2654633 RepID=A0A8S1FC35_9PELO|nr:unnamed protein product [Caenorhabditis bovis]
MSDIGTHQDTSGDKMEVSSEGAQNYGISRVIHAHKSDAKSLALTKSGAIISSGRDETICFWNKKGGEFTNTLKLQQPKGVVVNSLAFGDTVDGWRLFAGRKDGTIAAYGSGSQEPLQIFKEHSNNVCCLYLNEKLGVLLSGSWDTSVIIWPINELQKPEFSALKLAGHTLSVWALCAFPDRPNHYLTAGADKTIRYWYRDEEQHVFKGHEDVVRALAVVSNDYFLSAGNDGFIIYWDVPSKTRIGRFKTKAHDFIYSMTLCDSHILTTGEDGTLEFWEMVHSGNDNKHMKIVSETIIQTPAASTWDVKVLPSSDIAVSASDGRIYVFSKDRERQAPEAIREAFDAEVVAKISSQMERKEESDTVVIKVALDDGPAKLDLMYKKGADPTITAENFIRENGLPVSYLNEVVDYICQNIPEAAAARNRSLTKQPMDMKELDGRRYDHIFDVTLENGQVLKMPYNNGDDPDYAAQMFVEKHNLPVKFLGLLSKLIREETRPTADFYDPLTGSGRYVPGSTSSLGGEGFADPLTGEGRYVPGSTSASSGYSGDPLTGSGAYRSGESAGGAVPLSMLPIDKKRPRGPLVPLQEFISFGLSNASQKAIAKLKEVNERQDQFGLTPDEISALEELHVLKLSDPHSSETLISALEKGLQWQILDIAPILDFLRIGLLHAGINNHFCAKSRGVELVGKFVAILISDPADLAVRVFVCRCIANAFNQRAGRALFASCELSTLAPLLVAQMFSEKAILQVAAASALANWALAFLNQSNECDQLGPREDLLRFTISGIENISSFGGICEDARIYLLQAIVTLMWGNTNVIKLAKNRNMATIAARIKDAVESENGKCIARDIIEMTYAI